MTTLALDSVMNFAGMVAASHPGTVPCREHDSDLWFSDERTEIEAAQRLCRSCPLVQECFASALQRAEPCGVWGGELFQRGRVVAGKRGKGRPRKDAKVAEQREQDKLRQRLAELEGFAPSAADVDVDVQVQAGPGGVPAQESPLAVGA